MSIGKCFAGLGMLVLGLGLFGLWGVSAAVNFAHVYQGSASNWAHLIAGASAGSDIIKAAAGLTFIGLLRHRHWTSAAACAVIWLIVSLWSVICATSFFSTHLEGVTATREMRSTTDNSIQNEITGLTYHLDDARRLALSARPAERAAIQANIDLTEARLEALRSRADTRQGTGAADPVSVLLKRHFGVDEATTSTAKVILFVLLLEVTGALGLVAFSRALRWPPAIWTDPPALTLLEPQSTLQEPAPTLQEPPSKSRINGIGEGSHVARFLRDMIANHGAQASIPKKVMREQYASWCETHHAEPLSEGNLGFLLTQAGVRRTRPGGQHCYVLPAAPKLKAVA